MDERRLLSTEEAEAVVDERIDHFGLASLPHVSVTAVDNGMWRVRWDDLERTVAPMSHEQWCEWLVENVGSLDAGDLVTTES